MGLFADLPSPNSDYTPANAFQNIPILNYQSSILSCFFTFIILYVNKFYNILGLTSKKKYLQTLMHMYYKVSNQKEN